MDSAGLGIDCATQFFMSNVMVAEMHGFPFDVVLCVVCGFNGNAENIIFNLTVLFRFLDPCFGSLFTDGSYVEV